jgi:SAM-dependent methyltransferase
VDREILRNLQIAYDQAAEARDQQARDRWKQRERDRFLSLLRERDVHNLLEIGPGPGPDSIFFKENGLAVRGIDLSEENAARCLKKGVTTAVMDCTQIAFREAAFEAAYTFNCLLHIPHADIERVLGGVRKILKPGGLFYLGQYGGTQSEGIWEEDHYRPKRFFAFLTDDQIQTRCAHHFHILDFQTIPLENMESFHFQSLILEKTESAP